MIEVKNINKSFDDKQVLCDISATFYDGKTNLIIGLSGSGKTVLMKSMVGLVTPESGEILYDGRDLLKMDLKQKKELRKEIVRDLTVSANGSLMYTNVILPEGGSYTNDRRSLQGASPYLANADISYTPSFSSGGSLSLALLYNLQGPRIHAVGVMGLGDVRQMPVHTLDFNGAYSFDGHFSLKFAFKNLLDTTIRFTQDIPNAGRTVEVEQWKVGTGFEIGISYSL